MQYSRLLPGFSKYMALVIRYKSGISQSLSHRFGILGNKTWILWNNLGPSDNLVKNTDIRWGKSLSKIVLSYIRLHILLDKNTVACSNCKSSAARLGRNQVSLNLEASIWSQQPLWEIFEHEWDRRDKRNLIAVSIKPKESCGTITGCCAGDNLMIYVIWEAVHTFAWKFIPLKAK